MLRIKLKWIWKLLRAKFFVVMTEKEGTICIYGIDPNNIMDIVALTAQAAEMDDFAAKLAVVQKDHERAIRKLVGIPERKKNATKNVAKRKSQTKTRN